MPPCGAVARSTRYSAPRAPGYSGTPQPISLMDRRGAGGAGGCRRSGLRPPVGVATGAGAVRGSAGDARRRACNWNGPQHVPDSADNGTGRVGLHIPTSRSRAPRGGEVRDACDITGMAGRRSGATPTESA
jgi:hypothetical protein